ncbi:MAG: transglutaminase family protein [Verrucomicrobia bacterium]|nr:MAG: transglutaminase family protein [Verrucomicrobiota bacterium]
MADATTATAIVSGLAEPASPGIGTKLAVLHRTTFHYAAPVSHSLNTLHLEPRTFPYQKTLSSLIRVLPATRLRRFTDLFQNHAHHFELIEPHVRLEIESRLRVHNLPLVIPGGSRTAGREDFAERGVQERIWPYLQESNRVRKSPDVWRQAVDVTCGLVAVFEQAGAVMEWIHREFRYEPGSTGVKAHLDESFALKRGVCQDFTHVMVGMCRTVGVPARYASGYLYNGPRDSLVGAQASHAWCEVYLPGAGWIGFDPTNNQVADERYVKVAVGRDYDDVAPVVGCYSGSGHCRLEVCVEVGKI